jgi:hypothetical protein
MWLRNKRLAFMLPAVLTAAHLLLTAIAEIQYRTGWAYIPPNVEFDPMPLPIAEKVGMCLSLPAFLFSLPFSYIADQWYGIEGTRLMLVETPFVVLLWVAIGYWLDDQLGHMYPQKRRSAVFHRVLRGSAHLCCALLFLLLCMLTIDVSVHHYPKSTPVWIGTGGICWLGLMLAMAIRPIRSAAKK